ncbi:S9 family peptidase [Paenibacillus sp. J2TS4]|uniref:alpha/beta hydrolase family protein n=1 Tax=Paenibacillus sp. J2TS4 TaxID=2807194 RepID=UPI001AFFD746|nr:alpha/beta hydrolase family protein [Paenibacillus sp. J2TS4]GIP32669.1 hypothetical protein J2TS4_18790 [Paenibacillus sp. J2TS4]
MIFINDKKMTERLLKETERVFSFDNIGNYRDLSEWQEQFRRQLGIQLGLDSIRQHSKNTELNPRIIGVDKRPDYVLEKGYIRSEPGVEIPFFFLLPGDGQNGPYPLALTPHGHNRRGKEVYVGNYENEEEAEEAMKGERNIAVQAVAAGYAVLAPDVRGFWEMGREEEYQQGKTTPAMNCNVAHYCLAVR